MKNDSSQPGFNQVAVIDAAPASAFGDTARVLEVIDLCLQSPREAHDVALLYRVILGRRPDGSGLIYHVSMLAKGAGIAELVAGFLSSPEAEPLWSGSEWRMHARRNVELHPDLDSFPTPTDYCCAAIADDRVRRRYPMMEQLFPNGLPLLYPPAYALWRSQASAAAPTSTQPRSSYAVFVVVERFDPDALPRQLGEITRGHPDARIVLLVPPSKLQGLHDLAASCGSIAALSCAALGGPEQLKLMREVGEEFALFVCETDRLDAVVPMVLSAHYDQFDVILFDEDCLYENEPVARPAFCGGWDPHRLLSESPRHLIAVRASALAQIADRAPDDPALLEWWMALRLAASVERTRIAHAPIIGRRRSCQPGGPSLREGALALVQEAIERNGVTIDSVAPDESPTTRLRVATGLPSVSAIVLTRDKPDLLRRCLDGLLQRTDYPSLDIIVVDNGSTHPDALAQLRDLELHPRVSLISEPGVFNWGRFNNIAARRSEGEALVFLNNDIDILHSDWLRDMLGCLQLRGVGAVGAKLLYPDGGIQHAGIALDADGLPFHPWRLSDGLSSGYCDDLCTLRTVTAVTGACLAVKRSVWEEVGGIEECYSSYYSDVDFCMKVADTGRDIIWTPHARLLHLEQATFGPIDADDDRRLFQTRWPRHTAIEVFAHPHVIPDRLPRLSARLASDDLRPRPARRPRGDWRAPPA